VDADFTLLSTLSLLVRLNAETSAEQRAFARWHLAAYPSQSGDDLQTGVEEDGRSLFVHELMRTEQKKVGQILLEYFRKPR
jgi:hypothetical protein